MIDKILTLLGTLNSIWGSIMGRIDAKENKLSGKMQQQIKQFDKTMQEVNTASKAMLGTLDGTTDNNDPTIQRYRRKDNET